jgi:mono/diheme cytochrome c family protein
VKTITEGSPGTAMPSFIGLPLGDRVALAHFVRSLEPKVEGDKPEDLAWLGLGPGGTRLAGEAGAPAAAASEGPSIPIEEALKKLAEPEPPAGVALAPQLAEGNEAGAALYEDRCAGCHGQAGEGGIRVKILGSAPYVYVLSRSLGAGSGEWAADPIRFEKLILEGVPGTVMPGNGDLTRDSLHSLYLYTQMLRTQQEAAGRARS